MAGKATALTAAEFEAQVLQSEQPVLVDFGAGWCGPCRQIAPEVDAVAEQYAGRARVFTVDVDKEPDLAARYGVQGLPTLLVFKGGRPVSQIVGLAPRSEIALKLGVHVG